MAITDSAKKAIRTALRRTVFNVRRSDAARKVIKDIKKLVTEKKVKEAQALLASVYKAIDKAAKMNTWTKGAASRKKSRLAKLIKRTK
ncbi:MAG: 30S ribosomal protein S20 [Parcubacteria group bacterium GW2011_GWA2_47_16]|nr:MAG: 30S ribosomal protein S20 [Parcubacteria group bacterium GW2011_GWA2_47_16]